VLSLRWLWNPGAITEIQYRFILRFCLWRIVFADSKSVSGILSRPHIKVDPPDCVVSTVSEDPSRHCVERRILGNISSTRDLRINRFNLWARRKTRQLRLNRCNDFLLTKGRLVFSNGIVPIPCIERRHRIGERNGRHSVVPLIDFRSKYQHYREHRGCQEYPLHAELNLHGSIKRAEIIAANSRHAALAPARNREGWRREVRHRFPMPSRRFSSPVCRCGFAACARLQIDRPLVR